MADYSLKADSTEREQRLTLTDPILECDQGALRLYVSQDEQGRAKRISGPCTDQINIQTVTTILTGYKHPGYPARTGCLNADETTIDMPEDTTKQQTPYIPDYF